MASAQLEAAGVGLSGPLVDKEVCCSPCSGSTQASESPAEVRLPLTQGFPAANVDLYAVRADRQKIAGASSWHARLLT